MSTRNITDEDRAVVLSYKQELLRIFGGAPAMLEDVELKIAALLDTAAALATYTTPEKPQPAMPAAMFVENARLLYEVRSKSRSGRVS